MLNYFPAGFGRNDNRFATDVKEVDQFVNVGSIFGQGNVEIFENSDQGLIDLADKLTVELMVEVK